MNQEEGFLSAIRDKLDDDCNRLIYADWLEECGGAQSIARSEFIRVECELAALAQEDERCTELKARLKELSASVGPQWLALVSKPGIENCHFRFEFQCPKQWDKLQSTGDSAIRFCEMCRKNVYYCRTIGEARAHAYRGDCVAVDLRVDRREGDLQFRRMLLGKVAYERRPAPPTEEDEPGNPPSRRGRRRN
jgi:uncharacterized protein (TIGR02996 family)